MQTSPQNIDLALKDTSSKIGAGAVTRDKLSCSYDLVEHMHYLYVQVVKAKDLPGKDATGSCDPYVEVKLGNYKGITKHFENNLNPEWNKVFAFSKDRIQASTLEVVVKDKYVKMLDDLIGRVLFDLNEIPIRVPPDSPLAPHWYQLEDHHGNKIKGEIMVAVWMGTQADEAFPDAWHSDVATVGPEDMANLRSKVYLSPKLWYLTVNVIEAHELVPREKTRYPDVYVKAVLGNQTLTTQISQRKSLYTIWNENLMFVVAEPFEELLIISLEDRVAPNKDETLGQCMIPLQTVQRRADHRPLHSRWFELYKHILVNRDKKEVQFNSRIHLRIYLEGGYHVFDESPHYSSDLRSTVKQLWKPSIGILEVGIISAHGLMPMKTRDGRGTTDAYCVAKYGSKWVRTRTIVDSFTPKWNEHYTWDVFDPCTVITIGVFDNALIGGSGRKDPRFGKVRIRLSTLEANRVYTDSYPLLIFQPSGAKKMGNVQLAVRFTCSSLINTLHMYSQPLLPKMHYTHPLSVLQLDTLRYQAMYIVSHRLNRAEPPIRKEVVEYMLDVDSHMSLRRSKANFFRIMSILGGPISIVKLFNQICYWRNPITTILFHVLFVILVLYPKLILPMFFFYLFLIGIWNFRMRPRYLPHMDARLSQADSSHPDELDEEFDTFPSSRPSDIVRMRYDRLRSIAGRMQTVTEGLATQVERFESLLSWRDPRATMLFLMFYLVTAVVLYVISFQVVVLVIGIYVMRHPRLRNKLPSVPLNFFRRLPSRSDSML